MPKRLLMLLLIAAVLAGTGCAGMQRRPPPTLEQIVEMSREGVPAEDIIQQLKDTRAVYALSGSQLAKLHDQGVPEPVLDHLQQAYINSVRWQERMYYQDRFWMGGCVGCYYYRPWAAPHVVIPY
ncbi:MAG: hypothetical protein ACREU7_16650 [Burkholderiales bacterium]